jgi:hypothetical protein
MVVYTALLVVTSLVLVPVADLGWIYGVTAVLAGGLFLWGTVDLGRHPSPQRSMRVFAFSITYVTVLFVAITVDVLVRFAFGPLDLRRLEADVDPRNTPSLRLVEKLGFVREGYMRERWELQGEIQDGVFFGLLRREWNARTAQPGATAR